MNLRDALTLLSLSALWGASYLFMRLGAGEFGAWVFGGLRATLAAAVLLPLLVWRDQARHLREHGWVLGVVGLTQSALPFVLFGYAAPRISTGLAAILGATTPLFAATIAWLWSGEQLGVRRVVGLLVGFAGVIVLVLAKSGVALDGGRTVWTAMAACVGAAIGYGFSANYAKRYTAGLPVLAVAAGSQVAAALVLAPGVVLGWPHVPPTLRAWGALLALAVLGTALAYLLFFRLIARIGPSRTVTVTFLVPVFGVMWGGLFLDERLGPGLLAGGAIVLTGTALTVAQGIRRPRLAPARPAVLSSSARHG